MTLSQPILRLLTALTLTISTSRAAVDIDVRERFQTMQGFGTSVRLFDDPHLFENFDPATARAATVLTELQQNVILDRLYYDLKLTWVRPATDGGIEPQNDNDDPEVTDLSKFNFEWKRNDAHVDYLRRVTKRGVKNFFLSPLAEEKWMGQTTARDVAEYTEWCLAMVRRWRTLGMDLPYFSIFNEPSNRAGFTPQFMRDITKRLGAKLRSEGFSTKIVIPDDVNADGTYNQIQTILSDPEARSYVGAIATHLYERGDPLTGMQRVSALARQYNLPLWMTEYSRGAMRASAFDYAEQVIHRLIAEHDVTVQLYMWGFLGQWEQPDFHLIHLKHNGIVYSGYDLDKMYFVLGQYSRFVPPGSIRVKATSTNAAVRVTSYITKDGLAIVAVNNTDIAFQERFQVQGIQSLKSVEVTRTSRTEEWSELPAIAATGTAFSAALAPRSVTTFIAKAPFTATNAASLIAGPVAPGQIVTLWGAGLGPETGAIAAGRPTVTLAGTRILFDGVAAPLSYVSERQVNAIVPLSISGRSSVEVQAEVQGRVVGLAILDVVPASPGIFTATGDGRGQAAILNQDTTVNSLSNPAARNSIVSIYATGQGTGSAVSVRLGEQPADVLYAGAHPDFPGLLQVNARVPSGIMAGTAPILLSIGDALSQAGVTMAIQ